MAYRTPSPSQALRAARDARSAWESSPAAPSQDFVYKMDDNLLACRADRHSFPKLTVRNGKLPKGVSATRLVDGVFQLAFTCPDCGTQRIKTTLKGGAYDPSASYTYRYPEGYLSPKDSGLRRADYCAELYARVIEGGMLK